MRSSAPSWASRARRSTPSWPPAPATTSSTTCSRTSDFGKEAYRLSELRNPPFYGGWYGASILTTLDGLRINKHLQVLDTAEEPIPGLYAVGTCSGSYYSGNYPVYLVGNCLGRNMTFGYQVIKEIAGDVA